jgi:hypothetical protein
MWQYIPITKALASAIPRALRMDNVNDGAVAPHSELYNIGTGDFTVAVKFLAVGSAGSARMMHKLGATNGFSVTNNSNSCSFAMRLNQNTISRIAYSEPTVQGEPTLLAMSREGNPIQASSFSLYREGVKDPAPVITGPWPLPFNGNLDSTEPLTFNGSGSHTTTSCYYFFSAFWKRALTAEEHADLRLGILAADGVLSAWRFDKPSGLVVEELGGSGLNLTVSGLVASEYTYGSLNNAWVPDNAIFFFSPNKPLSQSFLATKDTSITHIYRFSGASTTSINVQYSHTSATGEALASGTITTSANTGYLLPLDLKEGEMLMLTVASTSLSYAIEIHYT